MGRINVLPQSVSELIAAGEVIDRPASIVKELVENSLDAGARRISVEIKGGGIEYIRVSDNGSGISREDLPLAFIRHATSKISAAGDLDSIATLGFRGEALPSVAAVSRVRVTTRTAKEPSGSCLFIDGSGNTEQSDCGCAVGTVIEVRDLFYNTPARMKFLKKDVTEGNAVASLMDRLSLANPAVAFELVRDGKRTLQTPGDGLLWSAVRVICGSQTAAGMVPVSHRSEGISVNGLISRPSVSRTTRSLQIFFINSRYVRSKTCAAAVEEAYKNRMMTGRFPACVINLEIDCRLVDVNVHPAKLEVRFSDERAVYNTVYRACMEALAESEQRQLGQSKKINYFTLSDFDHSDRQTSLERAGITRGEPAKTLTAMLAGRAGADTSPAAMTLRDSSSAFNKAPLDDVKPNGITEEKPVLPPSRTNRRALDIERLEDEKEPPAANRGAAAGAAPALPFAGDAAFGGMARQQPEEAAAKAPAAACAPSPDAALRGGRPEPERYRVIGELFDTYILVERGESFILIDKHAAHERYIYNSIRHLESGAERQLLLSPQPVSLSRDEYFALSERPEALEALGIQAEDFGGDTMLVREIPMILDGFPLPELLGEVAKKLMAQKSSATPELLDELLYSVSCRAAVMAGRRSALPELEILAEMALGPDGVRYCPHGRPVMAVFTKREVEKLFGRIG